MTKMRDLEKDGVCTMTKECLSTQGQKIVLNRFARVIGHVQAIKRMVEERRDIESILIQISAVRAAVNGIRRVCLAELLEQRYGENFNCSKGVHGKSTDFEAVLALLERYMR